MPNIANHISWRTWAGSSSRLLQSTSMAGSRKMGRTSHRAILVLPPVPSPYANPKSRHSCEDHGWPKQLALEDHNLSLHRPFAQPNQCNEQHIALHGTHDEGVIDVQNGLGAGKILDEWVPRPQGPNRPTMPKTQSCTARSEDGTPWPRSGSQRSGGRLPLSPVQCAARTVR